jgi:hypothetical protein
VSGLRYADPKSCGKRQRDCSRQGVSIQTDTRTGEVFAHHRADARGVSRHAHSVVGRLFLCCAGGTPATA